jgi:hypothetical protein
MAFSNRRDVGGLSSSAVIVLIQSHVKIEQAMVGTVDGVNMVFTVPNSDSVYNNMITIYVGGGELEPPNDYTINSATQVTLTNPPTTRPQCSYVTQ